MKGQFPPCLRRPSSASIPPSTRIPQLSQISSLVFALANTRPTPSSFFSISEASRLPQLWLLTLHIIIEPLPPRRESHIFSPCGTFELDIKFSCNLLVQLLSKGWDHLPNQAASHPIENYKYNPHHRCLNSTWQASLILHRLERCQ